MKALEEELFGGKCMGSENRRMMLYYILTCGHDYTSL